MEDITTFGRSKFPTNEDQSLHVLFSLMDNLTTKLASDNNIIIQSYSNIEKKKYKPYKVQPLHGLNQDDSEE